MKHKDIIQKVCQSIDILVEAGEAYEGLFPSVLSLDTCQMPHELPPAIPGQRGGDRSHPGSNLIHDEALLMTMYALSKACDRGDYAQAADRYLKRFATHCTDTATGLFPWGEHAFWHLKEDKVGGGKIHDHLRQAPVWLWEKLYEYNPSCVERFAEGLDYHWKDGEPLEYTRHAAIVDNGRQGRDARSCDFPRHSGFYILDLSFAYIKTQREDFLQQIHRMLDYWWEKRDADGMLLIESRSPQNASDFHNANAPGQTASLGTSLLESAAIFDEKDPELAAKMRQRALVYIEAFLSTPHDLDAGTFILTQKRGTGEVRSMTPIWGSVYGVWPASYVALTCLCSYRLAENENLLRCAESTGRAYLREPLPDNVAVPAMDVGLALGLLVDLYDVTGDDLWLEGGLALAEKLMAVYMDNELPRGAAGIDWYESQMGPGFLLHGLARAALLAIDKDNCPLAADYTAR